MAIDDMFKGIRRDIERKVRGDRDYDDERRYRRRDDDDDRDYDERRSYRDRDYDDDDERA